MVEETPGEFSSNPSGELTEQFDLEPFSHVAAQTEQGTRSVNESLCEKNIFDVDICYNASQLFYFNVEEKGTSKTKKMELKSKKKDEKNKLMCPNKIHQEVEGNIELCSFVINHFEKVYKINSIFSKNNLKLLFSVASCNIRVG